MAENLSQEKYIIFPGIPSQAILDKIESDTLPYGREKAVSSTSPFSMLQLCCQEF